MASLRIIAGSTVLLGISFVAMLALAASMNGCGEPQKYSSGKDTVRGFGDGTWEISKSGGVLDEPRKLHLYNHDEFGDVISDVVDWQRQGEWVYLLGADSEYAVLNYRTNDIKRYKLPADAPEEHRPGLGRLRPK